MHSPTVLIIKPSSLGDIVHGLLVAQMIKVGFPEARIDWVCRDVFAPLVAACPVVDDVLLFQRHGGPTGFLRLIRAVRKRRYSHVLDMQGLARSGLIALAARADVVVGRDDAREGARIAYHRRTPLPTAGRDAHAVDVLAEFLPLLGLPRNVVARLPFRSPSRSPFRLFGRLPEMPPGTLRDNVHADRPGSPELSTKSPTPGQTSNQTSGPILLFPESSRPEKNWPGYAALTKLLLDALPDAFAAWAGAHAVPSPSGLAGFSESNTPRFLNMTGQTSLSELPWLIAQARLVVGNDSGPLHLAAAMGVPTLALFGPTAPAKYRPYPGDDRRNRVLCAPGGDMGLLRPEVALGAVLEAIRIQLSDLAQESG
ncbi:glycosyltransferase family 9 protein [Desulfonatronum lacustre]|uniref:glycosyltransferase family 9 protein n=1 Tax=Desulfonatronum lacustre TaxID=66849 RepID=UPI00048FBE34|nr:glycosyltransferase family 9 protein [Desulfonatronum lacustre]SMP42195.1 heptosyltransferase-1/heptosyltransferase I [Desulfonatronum zhilinae]